MDNQQQYSDVLQCIQNIQNKDQELILTQLRDKIQKADLDSLKILLKNKRLINSLHNHDLLKLALINGHSDIFFELVKYGAPVLSYVQSGQNTLLHYAAKLEDEKPVEFLIKHDADVNVTNDKNETPLHIAAKNENKNILNILLKKFMENDCGCQNVVDSDGLSLFHIICIGSNSNYVTYFLQNTQVSINDSVSSSSKFYPGYSPLHFAVAYCRITTVKILLELGANLEAKTTTRLSMLHLACNLADVQWMMYEAISLTKLQTENLRCLFQNIETICVNRLSIIEILLRNKCNISARDNDGNNPLMYAVSGNYNCIFQIILQSRFELTPSICLEIQNRFVFCQLRTIEKIFEYYSSSSTFHHNSINDKRLDKKDNILKKQKQLVNYRNNFGSTCLHHVAATKCLDTNITQLLIKYGAEIDVYNNDFSTPLHLASKNNMHEFVKSLLNFNTNLLTHKNTNLLNSKKATSELVDPRSCDTNALKSMINVDAQDNAGNTALYYAYLNADNLNEDTCFNILLEYGADLSIENESGKTSLAVVREDILKKVSHKLFSFIMSAYKNVAENKCADSLHTFEIAVKYAVDHNVNIKFISNIWNHLKKLEICNSYNDRLNDHFLGKVSAALHISKPTIATREEFIFKCKNEVDKMKEIKLSKCVCLQDVLSKSINKVVLYTKNDLLREILESPDFAASFPNYEKLLRARYVRALARHDLLEQAMKSLKSIIQLDIPDLCLEKMLSFLSEKKLRDIIEVDRVNKRKNFNSALTDICEPLRKMVRIS